MKQIFVDSTSNIIKRQNKLIKAAQNDSVCRNILIYNYRTPQVISRRLRIDLDEAQTKLNILKRCRLRK